jgi:hypothetical protein
MKALYFPQRIRGDFVIIRRRMSQAGTSVHGRAFSGYGADALKTARVFARANIHQTILRRP